MRPLLLAVGTFLIGTDVFVIAGMLPQIGDSLNVSVSAAGQLMTVFSVGYAVLGPLLAVPLSRRSPRAALTAALVAVALGNAVCAVAGSLPTAMAGRLLVAAGASQFTPHASSLAAALAPKGRSGKSLALVTSGLVMGSVVGVPSGTWAADVFGWRPTLAALAAATAAVAVPLAAGLRGVASQHTAQRPRERFAALRGPLVRMVLTVTIFAVIAEYAVLTYAATVFAGATAGEGSRLAVLLFAFGLGGLVGNFLAGVYMDRPAGRRLVLVSVAGMTVAFLAMPQLSGSFPGALVAMVLWGVTGWMYAAPQQHRLLRLAGPAGPVAVSLNSSVIYVGAALGGGAGGLFLGQAAPRWLPLMAAVLCASAVVTELRLLRKDRPTEPAPAPV
ncbi:MFS transporter [Streptomyces olivaceus]|uniref:MFS transporter n=1 Tax=Streptomyces olivaceus TaxID=47716 RepID=UPI001CCE3E21|nr:MFS transporter [Streptomyces olivaceus]MBZ6205987.1 MFS transporter [Streptomyces olivaceus]